MKHICILAALCCAVGLEALGGESEEKVTDEATSQAKPAEGHNKHAPKNWADVRVGMSKEEVRAFLGEPKSEFPSPSQLVKPVAKSLFTLDRWWPERFMMATALAFDPATYGGSKGYHEGWEYPRDQEPVYRPSYYVYFDANGKVVRLSAPTDPDRQPLIEITEFSLDRIIFVWEETAGVTVEHDQLLTKKIMVNIEDFDDPNMLKQLVQEASEINGLTLEKITTGEKTVYKITKKEDANHSP